jgi:hypothetical protein
MKKVSEQIKTKAYGIGVMKLLKEVAEAGDDVHGNHTPLEICDMMLDKVDLVLAKSILVLYNIELLFALRKEKYKGQVTFFTQSTKKADLAPKILEGVAVEYIDKEENPLYFMENKWPDKFDIVIANPPYNKALHLKFLEKSMGLANDRVVFVHPGSFLCETKGKHGPFIRAKELIKEKAESLDFFNGNGIFQIGLFVPCLISNINMKGNLGKIQVSNSIYNNHSEIKSTDIDGISMFGVNPHFQSFKTKVRSSKNLNKFVNNRKNGNVDHSKYNFTVGFTRVIGHIHIPKSDDMTLPLHKDDFFCILNKKSSQSCIRKVEQNSLDGSGYDLWFGFSTEEEAKNFKNYLETDFARACLTTSKFAQSLYAGELETIPWMDFTQEWNDEKLYSHFNITEEEQAFIKEVIPPYYD